MIKFWSQSHQRSVPCADASLERNLPLGGSNPGCPEIAGLLAGTQIATEHGWTPVEQVLVGDRVMTFDHGPQTVTAISRRLYPYALDHDEAHAVVVLPTGLLGNLRPVAVLPGQVMLAESDLAESILGDPFAPLRAGALSQLPGVMAMLPEASVTVVTLAFEHDQAIFVEGQALAVCPAAQVLAPATLDEAVFGTEVSRSYQPLEGTNAALLAGALAAPRQDTAH